MDKQVYLKHVVYNDSMTSPISSNTSCFAVKGGENLHLSLNSSDKEVGEGLFP